VPIEVKFGLLGPLDVRRGDLVVPVAAGRQRAVLAALLLHAGRLVSVDELIEVLWQAGPPPTARASLQNYVRRLRKALGDDDRRLIGTRPGGYQINVGPGGLDVTRFVELLGAAREAARDGVWGSAADQAAAALALWRGEPLADAGSDVLAAREVPRLAELRWQALELRIDADLRLGRHGGVIGELRGLVAADPLRERWHALLMLALHRDGRQGEALAAYQQARGVLAEELGAEPGAGLRELHQQILTDDPALAVAGAAPAVAAGTVATRTLPRDVPSFTGRRDELARLTSARADAGAVVGIQAIGGMAGVGKTAFAVHAAHQLVPRFPDGQLFVPLHGHTPGHRPVEPAEALADLLLTTGLTAPQIPPGLEERAGLWRDRLAGRRVLLVLDDAVNSAQVGPLLPGTGGCLVLVTSRRHLTALADAEVISLDVLPPEEAAELLVRLAARPGLAPGDAAVAEICALCGYLPLAIGMMGRRLHHHPAWTPAGLAADLAATRDRLELMTAENLSVAAGLDLSYADLTTGQKRLFRRLGLHPGGDIDAYAAAAVDGCSVPTTRRALAALYDNYLLTEPAAGRYRLHDLIREHARTLAVQHDPVGDRDQALARLLDYYTHTAALAEVHLARQTRPTPAPPLTAPPCAVPDMPDSTRAMAWARAERANLLACLDYATEAGQHARVVALTAGLAGLLRQDGPWADAVTRHDTAVRAAKCSRDRLGQANALNNLATVRSLTGDQKGAAQDLEAALALSRDLGDRLGQANALNNLGHVRYLTDDYRDAAQALEAALALSRDLGDRLGQANALNNLGHVRYLTGDYGDAAQALQAALALSRDLGHRLAQANALNYLGHVRRMTGDYSGAAQALEAALALSRDLGDRLAQANALNNLGHVRYLTGDYGDAAQALEAALALSRDLGHRLAQANALAVLGMVRRMTRDYLGAAAALEDALSIYRDLGERGGAAEALNEAGTLYRMTGNMDRAETCHRQALKLAHDIGSSYDEAHALAGLGRCALAAGRPADAEPSLRQAQRIFQRIGTADSTTMAAEPDAFAENRLAAPPGDACAIRAGHGDALAWGTDSAGH
jgi:DNA-binding SARP family transcriptional activator/tetratricopeptide (TPR) repeat protein